MRRLQFNLLTYFLIFLSIFFSLESPAVEMTSCLNIAAKIEYRLNRIEAVQSCFEKNKKQLNSESCFKGISSLKPKNFSLELIEQFKAQCFYEVSHFKSIDACLQKAKTFDLAGTHDEAIFECYSQFQDELNQKQCLAVSQLLRYPAKKDYLAEHCLTK